jgi:hypothetical protein
MADATVLDARSGGSSPPGALPAVATDTRRRLQLVLAGIWLLDGVLQLQPYMFTKSFAWMTLGPAAQAAGPHWVAAPMNWVVQQSWQHAVATNTVFALFQLLLGLGIAYRRTLRPALAASIVWAAAVWWLGEGFGGMFSGTANPLTGAPGAVILYALAAVLLWPIRPAESDALAQTPHQAPRFQAAAWIGALAARILWLVLWGLLAFLALRPANRAPDEVNSVVTGSDAGAPSGLVWLDNRVGDAVAGRGLAISITLAVLFALIAVSVFLPWRKAVVAGLIGALVLAAVIWVFGEGFGMPFQGMATDPNTGPLLALLAVIYWPTRAPQPGVIREEASA